MGFGENYFFFIFNKQNDSRQTLFEYLKSIF